MKKYALLSVFDKTRIVDLAKNLLSKNYKLLSTGGTANLLRNNNIEVLDVSSFTNFPEILEGRVKTLHPNIFGGILANKKLEHHMIELEQHNIKPIDLVVCLPTCDGLHGWMYGRMYSVCTDLRSPLVPGRPDRP